MTLKSGDKRMWSFTTPASFRSKIWGRDKGGKKALEIEATGTTLVGSVGDVVDSSSSMIEVQQRRKRFEDGRQFQESWSEIFPWCEELVRPSGEIAQVKCTVCSRIEGVDKILKAKLDRLRKHSGRKKAEANIPSLNALKGGYYIDQNCGHQKNEKLIFSLRQDTVVQQLAASRSILRRKKLAHFTVLLHLLSQGRPITDFTAIESLLKTLKVPELPNKHWCEKSGWEMAHSLCNVISHKTKAMIAESNYISMSVDEVTSVDNQQWLSVHVYCVKDWHRVPILLSLSRVVEGCGADNLKQMITSMAVWHGGLNESELSKKLVCFGADGASVFQGSRTGVCAQLQAKHAPFMVPIHCMAHRTNLAVQAIGSLSVVKGLETLCQQLNPFLSHSPKRALEFQVLAESLELEALKILRNVKTRWISVHDPIIRIRDSYQALVVQMAKETMRKDKEQKKGVAARKNLDMLSNVTTFLSICCILPMLGLVHDLIIFAQGQDVFICDYIAAVEMCIVDLEYRYVDSEYALSPVDFPQFCEYIENRSYCMKHEWVTDLNSVIEYLSFRIGDHTYPIHSSDVSGKKIVVTRDGFAQCIASVKQQCSEGAMRLIKELRGRFPNSTLLSAFGIVFPQFWRTKDCDTMFLKHVGVLKKHFAILKSVDGGEGQSIQVPEMLNSALLDTQAGVFKSTMKNNWEAAMGEPRDINPLTKLWHVVGVNPLLQMRMSEYFKLAEIAVTCVVGSVEDERTFSNLAFIKSKLRNRLTLNLDYVVRMFAQSFYTVQDFPYDDAITNWLEVRDRRSAQD